MSADQYLVYPDTPLVIDVVCYMCSKTLHEGEIIAKTHANCLRRVHDREGLPIIIEVYTQGELGTGGVVKV